jgi:hypothetical protein
MILLCVSFCHFWFKVINIYCYTYYTTIKVQNQNNLCLAGACDSRDVSPEKTMYVLIASLCFVVKVAPALAIVNKKDFARRLLFICGKPR